MTLGRDECAKQMNEPNDRGGNDKDRFVLRALLIHLILTPALGGRDFVILLLQVRKRDAKRSKAKTLWSPRLKHKHSLGPKCEHLGSFNYAMLPYFFKEGKCKDFEMVGSRVPSLNPGPASSNLIVP